MYHFEMPVARSEQITVRALCPKDGRDRYGVQNWSLSPLQTQEDAWGNLTLATGLTRALRELEVRTAYAPNVAAASARVVNTADLRSRIRLNEIDMYRRRDLPADGIFLKPGEAFMMSGAGCPLIIASAGEPLLVAHAGRDSLVDRGAIAGSPSRRHVSVVHAIVEAFRSRGVHPERIRMTMLFAIPTETFEHRFDHPYLGDFNRKLGAFINARWPGCTVWNSGGVFLNLEFLFLEQATQAGVRDLDAMRSLTDCPRLAHTRDGNDPNRRNLYVVKRHG